MKRFVYGLSVLLFAATGCTFGERPGTVPNTRSFPSKPASAQIAGSEAATTADLGESGVARHGLQAPAKVEWQLLSVDDGFLNIRARISETVSASDSARGSGRCSGRAETRLR